MLGIYLLNETRLYFELKDDVPISKFYERKHETWNYLKEEVENEPAKVCGCLNRANAASAASGRVCFSLLGWKRLIFNR